MSTTQAQPGEPGFGLGRPWEDRMYADPLKVPKSQASPDQLRAHVAWLRQNASHAAEWVQRLETGDPTQSRSRYREARGFQLSLERLIARTEEDIQARLDRQELVRQTAPAADLAPSEAAPEGYEERAMTLTLDIKINTRLPRGQSAPENWKQHLYDIATHFKIEVDDWDLPDGDITDFYVERAGVTFFDGPFVDGAVPPQQVAHWGRQAENDPWELRSEEERIKRFPGEEEE
jgi:hypothetical protein